MSDKFVAMDTNIAIFLCDALHGDYDPQTDNDIFVRQERKAIYMVFIYMNKILRITPTVKRQINREDQHKIHLSLFQEIPLHNLNCKEVDRLSRIYNNYHNDLNDCKILAEAECGGCDLLLTYDNDFMSRLKDKAHIKMVYPSIFWKNNAPPKGSKPELTPRFDNPKITKVWYKRD